MSVIASIAVPADSFTLGRAVSDAHGARIRLDRVIPVGGTFAPYIWASDETVEAIEARLDAAEDVEAFRIVETANGEALVRVEWAETVDGLLETMADAGVSILEGVGEHDVWRLQLRFEDHDQLSAFFERCAEKGIPVEVEAVHNPGIPEALDLKAELTDAQRETLEVALRRGYFDVPRRVNLAQLAEHEGVSDSAVSQRLRRGIATVLRNTGIHDGRVVPKE